MKNKNLKSILSTVILIIMVGTLAGCASSTSEDSSTSNNTKITGSITASGSTALQPLAEEAAKSFQEKNIDATVTIQGGGSGTGLKDSAAGNVQIGNSDVFAEEKLPADQAKLLVDHKVGVVGFAAVVNENVKVTNLTKVQLVDIFTGKIKNWKEVGGSDMGIVILNRPTSSGTRATFKRYALGGKDEAQGTALTEDSSGAVSKTLKATPGSISYLASSFLNNATNKQGIKILQFGGVDMTPETITSGKYDIWSYEHMYTKGEATGITKNFIDYITGTEFKATVTKLGYIPITDMKVTR